MSDGLTKPGRYITEEDLARFKNQYGAWLVGLSAEPSQ